MLAKAETGICRIRGQRNRVDLTMQVLGALPVLPRL